MELTQQIECTQELYANTVEKEVPCQIGFLGICGVKYPLKKGPNKIGRDPNTCNIVLNLNSISRQHAVINILNSCDFMLMDLDSANKTKLADKTLQAYIPTPLKNGDMVQFGQVFGVFRLFEEDTDLPMTQALDIPETPVRNQHVSKVNLITTIPESPEVSDRDDSFIVASQPKPRNVFKSPSTNFIKSSGKTVTIKPVASNQIDNVYWSSSKKSDSFNFESETSINTETSNTKNNIHEQDTQIQTNINNFIYEADTQVGDNILPFHNIETELPQVDNLPEVHKVPGQENVNIDLFTENKENDNNIHNSETQDVKCPSKEYKNLDGSSKKSDVSDDIILFDEIECNPVEESFESQNLLLPELEATDQIRPRNEGSIAIADGEKQPQNLPISNRRDSGSSTDCEDINFALTQNIPETRTKDEDDITDCEDGPELNELNKNNKANIDDNLTDDNLTDCENEIDDNKKEEKGKINDFNLEDLATQVIEKIDYNVRPTTSKNIPCLEDLPTQVIDEDKNCRKENREQLDLNDLPTQILHQESQNNISKEISHFKVPVISPFQRKRKDQTEIVPNKGTSAVKNITKEIDCDDGEQYYAATQELLNDLCSQRELSPEIVSYASKNVSKAASDNYETNNKFTDLNDVPDDDIDEKIDKFVMNLTNSVKKDVGIEKEVAPLKKVSSDSSDFESTPIKLRPQLYLETELPSTPEIHTYLKQNGYASTESSKGSDTDCSNYGSPHRKKNFKDVRVDLTTQFEPERLPERVTRVRKPTCKMLYTEDSKNKMLHSLSFETDHSKEKVTLAVSKTVTSNPKEKSKRQTNRAKSNKNNVIPEINKSTENNKSKENVRTHENNKSNENVRTHENNKSNENVRTHKNNTRNENVTMKEKNKSKENVTMKEKNKSKENVTMKENNRSKENVTMKEKNKSKENSNSRENNKNNEHNKNPEYHRSKKRGKIPEKHNKNTSSNEIENKSEQKSTRKSSRRKNDEQHEVKKEDRQLKVITDEVRPLKTETDSIQKTNRGDNKTSRKESNTIDKYLSSTSAEAIQKDESRTTEKKNRRSKNKETTKNEASKETEVRRSKRQRTAKRSFDSIKPKSEQLKPSTHEQSAIYNMSSESSIESSKLKRQASDLTLPVAKKTKTINSSNVVLRSTPARKCKTQVLFTAFPCEEVKVKLEKLGAVVVTDIMQCTVVLTLQIRRTFKLLCAVGLGKPIVGPNWVQACVDTNMIVDPWQYLIKDELTEKRFQFNLKSILLGNRQFLKGYNVSSTPNIMPNPPEMKLIVECSGGTWNTGGKNWICVSSKSDKSLWTSLKRKGATIVSSEFILGGVLRQAIEIQRNILA